MANSTESKSILTLRQSGAYATDADWSLLEITGIDTGQYLQGRVTSDVKALANGVGQFSALLDRKAHLLANFTLHKFDDKYVIAAETRQIKTILEQLETYLFSEDVKFTKKDDLKVLVVQGAYAMPLAAQLFGIQYANDLQIVEAQFQDVPVTWIKRSITGEEGFLLFYPAANQIIEQAIIAKAQQFGMVALSDKDLNIARIEAGIASYGIDIGDENLLPETGLDEQCVSYTKGCYLGQEVIARVKAQGAPRRGLMGLIFDQFNLEPFAANTEFLVGSTAAGQIKSMVQSPTLEKTIALVMIAREFRIPGQKLNVTVAGKNYDATVITLPFFTAATNTERAKKLYDQALSIYTKGEDKAAIELLRQSLLLDPFHADSYEMLGVMLSKQGELTEAISIMKHLAEIDKESIMAHANLSMFYVQLGDKDKAEEEKAIAMSIRMQQAAKEAMTKQQAESEKQKKEAEDKQRALMFEQVLAIDKDDLLANFGLGNLLVELKQFERAVPYLEKAIELKPGYTAAYLALGTAVLELGQMEKAFDVFNKGITVATQRGEFEPMNKMKEKLSLASKKV